jgi:AcrR family transcriptional regulator
MKKKTDLRVIRTKSSIRKAFYELMKEKKFDKITVQDIADRAFINRNTFYLHYMDKDDLLEKISGECFDKMRMKLDSFDKIVSIEDVNEGNLYKLCCMSFEALLQDIEFYEMVFVGEGVPKLILGFTELLKKHMLSFGTDDIRFVYVEFISSALIGMMRYWVQNRDKFKIEEISRIIIDMYTGNIIDLLANPS